MTDESDDVREIKILRFGSGRGALPGLSKAQFRNKQSTPMREWLIEVGSRLEPVSLRTFKIREPKILEMRALARFFGLKRLPVEAQAELSHAIERFVDAICDRQKRTAWKEIDQHLNSLVQTGEAFLQNLRPLMGAPLEAEYVPAAQVVLGHFLASDDKQGAALACMAATRQIIEMCEQARLEIKPVVSTRGQKPKDAFHDLMAEAVRAAGSNRTLPSNAQKGGKENIRASASTPLLKFSRSALDLARKIGEEAVQKSDYSKDRKNELVRVIRASTGITDGALIDGLRKALKIKPLEREDN